MLRCKLKSVVARITTPLKHCYGTKFRCCKLRNMLQQVELASTFFNKCFICCSYYHPRNKFLRNKNLRNLVWLVKISVAALCEFSNINKDGSQRNELILLDQKLSEAQQFELFRELKNYPCLWESSKSDYKNRHMKAMAMETLRCKFNICSTDSLKWILHSVRTAFVRDVKREGNGQKSAWSSSRSSSTWKKMCFGQRN